MRTLPAATGPCSYHDGVHERQEVAGKEEHVVLYECFHGMSIQSFTHGYFPSGSCSGKSYQHYFCDDMRDLTMEYIRSSAPGISAHAVMLHLLKQKMIA